VPRAVPMLLGHPREGEDFSWEGAGRRYRATLEWQRARRPIALQPEGRSPNRMRARPLHPGCCERSARQATSLRHQRIRAAKMPDIAIGALVRNGAVLLARRSSERKVHPNRWSLPGGHIEDGEDAETAMRRELIEEIGVMPESWQFLARFVLEHPPIRLNQPDRKAAAPANESGAFTQRPDVSIWSANTLDGRPEAPATFHLYRVDRWQGDPRIMDDEHTELRWFTAAEIACATELAPPHLSELLAKLA
jgi:8-oxo-dGTP diphosphatase